MGMLARGAMPEPDSREPWFICGPTPPKMWLEPARFLNHRCARCWGASFADAVTFHEREWGRACADLTPHILSEYKLHDPFDSDISCIDVVPGLRWNK